MILTPPFAAVVPTALPEPHDEPLLPPVHLDPLAWSRDGKSWPTDLRVKPVEDGRSPQFVRSDHHRKWQAVVSGPNAAKSSKRYLEAGVAGRFSVAELAPGDVIEVGKINRSHRANFTSWRSYYVVVERTESGMVLALMTTKARALKLGNLRKALGAERATLLAGRAAVWEDLTRERSMAEVLEDEALEGVFA